MTNREIKFRVWNTKSNKMDYDPHAWDEYMGETMPINYPISWLQKSSEDKLMQFTGLKDSKGTEIYEGDIVYYSPLERNLEVWFGGGCFDIDRYSDDYGAWWENSKVIGNIYEDGHLLKINE